MAQLAARLVRNEKAGGSNPPSSTIRTLILIQSERPFVARRCGLACQKHSLEEVAD